MKGRKTNLRIRLICGGEKLDKSIPHLTARLASRFNWLRLLKLGSSSSSLNWVVVVLGSGTLALRRFPRGEEAKEKSRVFVGCVSVDDDDEVRRGIWWWYNSAATLGEVRWWL